MEMRFCLHCDRDVPVKESPRCDRLVVCAACGGDRLGWPQHGMPAAIYAAHEHTVRRRDEAREGGHAVLAEELHDAAWRLLADSSRALDYDWSELTPADA